MFHFSHFDSNTFFVSNKLFSNKVLFPKQDNNIHKVVTASCVRTLHATIPVHAINLLLHVKYLPLYFVLLVLYCIPLQFGCFLMCFVLFRPFLYDGPWVIDLCLFNLMIAHLTFYNIRRTSIWISYEHMLYITVPV